MRARLNPKRKEVWLYFYAEIYRRLIRVVSGHLKSDHQRRYVDIPESERLP
nr:MAG TPA: hypothetical protein [Caudoviricetes sp.]